eukprot:255572-Amphidinium_carterae.1
MPARLKSSSCSLDFKTCQSCLRSVRVITTLCFNCCMEGILQQVSLGLSNSTILFSTHPKAYASYKIHLLCEDVGNTLHFTSSTSAQRLTECRECCTRCNLILATSFTLSARFRHFSFS